jgi:hypothetical protein
MKYLENRYLKLHCLPKLETDNALCIVHCGEKQLKSLYCRPDKLSVEVNTCW